MFFPVPIFKKGRNPHVPLIFNLDTDASHVLLHQSNSLGPLQLAWSVPFIACCHMALYGLHSTCVPWKSEMAYNIFRIVNLWNWSEPLSNKWIDVAARASKNLATWIQFQWKSVVSLMRPQIVAWKSLGKTLGLDKPEKNRISRKEIWKSTLDERIIFWHGSILWISEVCIESSE